MNDSYKDFNFPEIKKVSLNKVINIIKIFYNEKVCDSFFQNEKAKINNIYIIQINI